ncbi:MAG: threonine aldolase family protein [Opitutales bacterium]
MSAPDSARPDYSFASDNTAGMTPEALAALTAANPGCVPSYGDDEWTARAKQLLCGVFATDCEVFFVFNGTAANSLALAHCGRSYQSVLCHDVSHVETDECGAPEFFTGGGKVIPVAGAGGKLHPADLGPVLHRGHGVHYPKPGTLSLTQSTEWGTVYTPAEVAALSAVARAHGLAVHMDGARFANAAAALAAQGHAPADFTWRAGVDVLSLGGTKNGMHTTEAVVIFRPELARDFAYRVKQGAQLASKQRFAAAQWCGMLEGGAWLRHAAQANAMARALAAALRGLAFKLIVEPEANGVFVELPPAVAAAMTARGWHFYRFIGEHGHRLMCSWATTPEQIARFTADLRTALGGAQG